MSIRIPCLLALLLLLPTMALALEGPRVGGPCRYADFPGKATIVAVTPATTTPGVATPSPARTVTFTFTPNAPLTGEPLFQPGKIHTLTLTNGMAPGPRFTTKYGIAPGKVFACTLRLIRQGTCTPVLFAFPAIDLTDYFELTNP